jgi:hypothetical protein
MILGGNYDVDPSMPSTPSRGVQGTGSGGSGGAGEAGGAGGSGGVCFRVFIFRHKLSSSHIWLKGMQPSMHMHLKYYASIHTIVGKICFF